MDTALLGEEGVSTIKLQLDLENGVHGSCQGLQNSPEGSQPASTKTSLLLKAKVK